MCEGLLFCMVFVPVMFRKAITDLRRDSKGLFRSGAVAMQMTSVRAGVHARQGEVLHINVNTGHHRITRGHEVVQADSLRAAGLIRVALVAGSVEMQDALSVLRLEATQIGHGCRLRISDGREPVMDLGILPECARDDRLWPMFWGANPRLGRDIVRPQCDVVLASLGKGLVHHARLSPQLDRFEMSAAIGWGLVLSS